MAGTDATQPERDRTLVQPAVARPAVAAHPAVAEPVATGRPEPRHAAPVTARSAVAAQHATFGGVRWGAAFFGWLSANGLAVLLIALLSAGGVALGLTEGLSSADEAVDQAAEQADTISVVGGIVLLVVLFLAYFAGGYVAGRMARFDGVRQGIAVWVIGLLVVLALAIAGLVLGSEYNVLRELNLPRIPIDEGTATTGGIIALVAVLLMTLLGAILGGKLGDRFHRKVDRAGFDAG